MGRKEKNKTDFFKLWSKLIACNPTVDVGISSPAKIDLAKRLKAAKKRIDRIRSEPVINFEATKQESSTKNND